MQISTTEYQGNVPVTILRVEGSLDGSNYSELISFASALYDRGARNILLDLSKLTYLSSAGISALHRVALMFRGKKPDEPEEGWAAFRAMRRDHEKGVQQYVKLLNPTEQVKSVLDLVGFSTLFEIYTDTYSAVASFQQ
jgi:anti-anti-sigma regulatory factor